MSTPYYINNIDCIKHLIPQFAKEFNAEADATALAHQIEMSNQRPNVTVIAAGDHKGFLWGTIIRGIILDDIVGYVNIIHVDPQARRQGIGTALIEKFKNFSEVHGAKKIVFAGTTDASRQLARKLGTLESEQYLIQI